MALTWHRDPDGYRIEQVRPPSARFKGDPTGPWIVRNGRRTLEGYAVRFAKEPLYKKLLSAADDENGIVAFVNEYGFLRHERTREALDFIHECIGGVGWLLMAAEEKAWDEVAQWVRDHERVIQVKAVFGIDELGRHEVQYQPNDLIGGIFLQLLHDYSSGAQYKRCLRPGCDVHFYYGPNTGRRSTADYCSPRCRVKHFEMKRRRS